MANYLKGEVDFEAQGKTWTLRLSMNDLITLQAKLGIDEDDVSKFFLELARLMQRSLKKCRLCFSVALSGYQPDSSEETAGEIITEIGFVRAGALLTEALKWAMPDAVEGGKGKGKASSPGVSTSSTQPGLA